MSYPSPVSSFPDPDPRAGTAHPNAPQPHPVWYPASKNHVALPGDLLEVYTSIHHPFHLQVLRASSPAERQAGLSLGYTAWLESVSEHDMREFRWRKNQANNQEEWQRLAAHHLSVVLVKDKLVRTFLKAQQFAERYGD